MPSVMFAIRGRLGDTLASYASVTAFADAHPDWDVTVFVRTAYACLFEREARIRIVPFGEGMNIVARLLWDRLTHGPYDVLAVAYGFGKPGRWLASLVRARRYIHYLGIHSDVFPEYPSNPPRDLFEPAWGAASLVAGQFQKPRRLHVRSLSLAYEQARASRRAEIIGVVPFAKDLRRNFDLTSLCRLLATLRRQHAHAAFRLFYNPEDQGVDAMGSLQDGDRLELRPFRSVRQLAREYLEITRWIGTDTGPFHLAVAMGIPTTVFLGPSFRALVVLPDHPEVRTVHSVPLANTGCSFEGCIRPACLHQAVTSWCAIPEPVSIAGTPASCPLRRYGPGEIQAITGLGPRPPHEPDGQRRSGRGGLGV